jgi:hypothetical protein
MSVTNVEMAMLQTQMLTGMTKIAITINQLELWILLNELDDGRRKVADELLDLEAKFAKLDTKFNSLDIADGRIKPPSDERMATISRLSDEVEELIRNQATATAMISLAGKTLELVTEVQKVGTSPSA